MIAISFFFLLELLQALVFFGFGDFVKLFFIERCIEWRLAILVEEVMHPQNLSSAATRKLEHRDSDGSFEGGFVICIGSKLEVFILYLPKKLGMEEEGVLMLEAICSEFFVLYLSFTIDSCDAIVERCAWPVEVGV